MKTILSSLLVIVFSVAASAADFKSVKTPDGKINKDEWYNNLTLEPVGVLKAKDITGPSQWGAGLDIGYRTSDWVSIHLCNLSYEGPNNTVVPGRESGGKQSSPDRITGQDDWGGLLVDETILEVRAKLTSFRKERFTPYVTASGQREWNDHDWGFRVGLGAELNVSKYVKLAGGYRVGAWKKAGMDSLADLRLVIPIP